MTSPVSDRMWRWSMFLFGGGCIASAIVLAIFALHDGDSRHAKQVRDECVDAVLATGGTRADIEKCFTPR